MEKIVIVTGGFDPVHAGHIDYINAAAKLGDKLVIGLNSDDWLTRKKGKPFMNWIERFTIMDALKPVHAVIAFEDDDGTAINCIKDVMERYPNNHYIFANGGDRINNNTPELVWANQNNVPNLDFIFGVGGSTKKNSSSWLLAKWNNVSKESSAG